MAAADYFDIVQKLYIAYYQRPADPGGLKYWADQISANGGNASTVVSAFAASPEAVALYSTVDSTTIDGVIDQIYLALFNRTPDAAGKKFYVDGFTAGTFTPGAIALDVLNGARSDDNTAILNKVQVANLFTAQVDGRALTDADFGTGTSFQATYSGSTDAQAARDILKAVTSSPATVLSPAQVTEQIKSSIADAGDKVLTPPVVGTFTVTNTAGVLSYGGTAAGDITFTVAADGTATFVREGVTAATTVAVSAITSAGGTIKLAANTPGLSVANTAAMTGITGFAANGKTYSISDTAAAVAAAAPALLSAASNIAATGAAVSAVQAKAILDATNSGTTSINAVTDTAARVSALVLGLNENITTITANAAVTVTEATALVALKDADTTVVYHIEDASSAVAGANALVLSTASTVIFNGTAAIDTIDMSAVGRGLTINAGDGADTVTGTAFADTISGGVGADVIDGGAGNDTIYGGDGADNIKGGAGNDTITGDIGADVITGGDGADVIDGGGDADIITGGAGADKITGGAGPDRIVYSALATEGGDTITDFTTSDEDILQFSSADLIGVNGFTSYAGAGIAFALSGGQKVQFVVATGGALVASDAQAAFLFDTVTGVLAFDADGTGAGAAITIATLTGVANLGVADFSFVA